MVNISAGKRSEEELVVGLKNRDASAFTYLVKNYSYALRKVLYRPDLNSYLDDLLQDTFVKIWERIHYFDATKGRLFTWMVVVARHMVAGVRVSKNYKKGQLTNAIDEYIDVHPYMIDQDDSLNNVEAINLLELAQKYTPAHSHLIKSYVEGYRYSEISEKHGVKTHIVKRRMNESLERIRQVLSADFLYLGKQLNVNHSQKILKEQKLLNLQTERKAVKINLGKQVKELKANGHKMKYIAKTLGVCIASCHVALRTLRMSENADPVLTLEEQKLSIGKKVARLRLKNLSMKAISKMIKVSVSTCYSCLRYLDEVNESKKDYGAYLKKMREIARTVRESQQQGKSPELVAKAIGVHVDTCYNALRMFKPQ